MTMPDMLVKLYDLPSVTPLLEKLEAENITIRRPIGPENYAVIRWINENFGPDWAGEAENAFFRSPKGVFIAVQKLPKKKAEVLGFACYDATVKGFFGPTGVREDARGKGIGAALLLATLHGMKDEGYGYGIIGGAGPVDFYKKCCGAVPIEGSSPGVYYGMVTIE